MADNLQIYGCSVSVVGWVADQENVTPEVIEYAMRKKFKGIWSFVYNFNQEKNFGKLSFRENKFKIVGTSSSIHEQGIFGL
jgi:hypothetical protein